MATMNRDGLAALYEYDAYANHLVLDGLAQLSEDEFAHAPSPSRSTVRTLFLHSLVVGRGFWPRARDANSSRLTCPRWAIFAAFRASWKRNSTPRSIAPSWASCWARWDIRCRLWTLSFTLCIRSASRGRQSKT